MKKLLAVSCLLLLCGSLYAQPYQSLFGNTHTAWKFSWFNMPGGVIDSVFVEKDTAVNGVKYKKLVTTYQNPYKGGLMREVVDSGLVYYRSIYENMSEPGSTVERVVFNYSLNEGDTFALNNKAFSYPHDISLDIVDSVRVKDGLKYIYFRASLGDEPFTMIEGIGSNMGVICHEVFSIMIGQYLLCSYKDYTQTSYRNIEYTGNCTPSLSVANTTSNKDIHIYPNPATDRIYIETTGNAVVSQVSLYNILGCEQLTVSYPANRAIPVGHLPTGIYLLNIRIDATTITRLITVQQ